jgi:carbonic anhydrase
MAPALTALAEGHDLGAAPVVADWLRHADEARARAAAAPASGPAGVTALVRANVAAQLQNLATHPSVTRALAEGALALHGWVFDIGAGTVETIDHAVAAA